MNLQIIARDYHTIKSLLKTIYPHRQAKEIQLLSEEIRKMTIIEEPVLPDDLVGINSEVDIHEVHSGKKMKFRITLPSLANIKERKISILAPLSIALLGFRKGAIVDWDMPGGSRKLQIISVTNNQ
jgi:regulator of nucleoside diphosphate kinase